MDYEIQDLLEAALQAVGERKRAGEQKKPKAVLRELDETVCLASRTLYIRYKSNVLMCRAVGRTTRDAVRAALDAAVQCLPQKDYDDSQKDYAISESVKARSSDFNDLNSRMRADESRPDWLTVPIEEVSVQPA